MTCIVCQDEHESTRIGVAKEVSGLKADKQVVGYFCPVMGFWIVKSSQLIPESDGILTLKKNEATILEETNG